MIDRELSRLIESETADEGLADMLKYCVLDGGKRIRPRLCLLTAEMLGVDEERALPFACAIELIHSYSLVHDDLPAMDNDDFRRGKPSCHKRFGEAQAILTGDALLTLAAATLCKVEGEQAAKREVFTAALAMVEGQLIDLKAGVRTAEERELLYRKKTGALMSAAVLSAARLAKCDEKRYNSLKAFSDRLGLLFQLTDDVLDKEQELSKVGGRICELRDEAVAELKGFDNSEKLLEIVEGIAVRVE